MKRRSDDARSIWEHILELRTYFFLALAALVVGAAITHVYHTELVRLLFAPLKGESLVFLSPLDPLLFILKIDFFGGLALALPVVLLCLFRFIAPAMEEGMNTVGASFLLVSLLLALAASVYTYLFLLPISIAFLLSIQVPGVENFFTADRYIDFVLMQLVLMVGIFQIPSVIGLLSFLRLLDPKSLSKNRGTVYVVAVIALSILTPTTDLYTLSLFLVPTLVVFECSLLFGRMLYYLRTRQRTHI